MSRFGTAVGVLIATLLATTLLAVWSRLAFAPGDDLILPPFVPQGPSALLGSVAAILANPVFVGGTAPAFALALNEWRERRHRC